MEPRVKASMSGDPVSIAPEASALEAHDLLVDRGIRHLPVVDAEGLVVGILSIDDLRAALPVKVSARAALAPSEREVAREWRVCDVMTEAPETVGVETPLAQAAERMAEMRIGCLPVVDDGGRLVGLLSETDALNALATTLWSDSVRERRRQRREGEDPQD